MFAGHVGAALVIARAEPRINAGTFVGAALLLDIVLWIFILLGWEAVSIPPDFATRHQAAFTFPYSHGLVAALAWSALAGMALAQASPALRERRVRLALLVGAAVFSHWVLDALVHAPEMPLAGAGSIKVGLGLWDRLPIGLGLEAILVALGLGLFLPNAGLSRWRRFGVATISLLLLVFTIAGMTVAPAPPSAAAMAGSSLVTLLVVCALFGWLDMARSPARRA
jgi:hypothetical protein